MYSIWEDYLIFGIYVVVFMTFPGCFLCGENDFEDHCQFFQVFKNQIFLNFESRRTRQELTGNA